PSVKPWYQISVRRAKILVHASSGSCLTASTLRFSSGWMMCSPTVDFHHLDKCHAWHTYKNDPTLILGSFFDLIFIPNHDILMLRPFFAHLPYKQRVSYQLDVFVLYDK